MTNVLAYDTTGESLSISIRSSIGTSHYRYNFGLRHGEILGDRVNKALEDHNLKVRDLEGVLCSRGPGSFTGLRIGMAFGKGLSVALGIPLLSISPLEAMAYNGQKVFSDAILLPVIDGKKKRFFWALYKGGLLQEGPGDWAIETIGESLTNILEKKGSPGSLVIISFDRPGFRGELQSFSRGLVQ